VISASKKYKNHCYRCFIHTFPDNQIVRNHKTKERSVSDFVKDTFPNYDWRFDKTITYGCSRRRPDIFCDFGSHCLIIEIDENQHTTYDSTCENKRLMELFTDVGNRPIVIIRFNPDSYKDELGKRVNSCWKVTKCKGLLSLLNTNDWSIRLDKLRDTINISMNIAFKEVTIINLYYDYEYK